MVRDMATNKNDIALSFDKAEYYSLQEASDYLNRKHGIDNVTPRKLLKHAVSYDVHLFVFGQGFGLFGAYGFKLSQQKIQELKEADVGELYKSIVQVEQHLNSYLSASFNDIDLDEGGFIGYGRDFLGRILTMGYSLTGGFANGMAQTVVPYHAIAEYNASKERPFLSSRLKKEIEFHKLESFYMNDCVIVESADPSQRALNLSKLHQNPFLEFVGVGRFFSWPGVKSETKELIFKIYEKDLVIFDKDLSILEQKIIENALIPHKEQPKINDNQLRVRGRSVEKTLAMTIANAHAQHLWTKDYDKKIRIGEMCENVWAYMIATAYRDQLPNDAKSLKDWLTDIPEYASQAGRPSEK